MSLMKLPWSNVLDVVEMSMTIHSYQTLFKTSGLCDCIQKHGGIDAWSIILKSYSLTPISLITYWYASALNA